MPGNPLLILLQSWSFEVNRYFVKDTAVNIVLYVPFGAACYLWLVKRPQWLKLVAPMLLALSLSASMEMLQLYDGKRVCSMLDVVTNFAGAGFGIVLAASFRPYVSMRPRAAAPVFLLLCWISANYYPFMPDLSGYHLLAKLRALAVPSFAPVAFFSAFATWLAAARVMEAAYSRPLFLMLLASLPLRFFVSGLMLSWTDVASAAAASAIWLSWPVKARGHDLALAALSLLAILVTDFISRLTARSSPGFPFAPYSAPSGRQGSVSSSENLSPTGPPSGSSPRPGFRCCTRVPEWPSSSRSWKAPNSGYRTTFPNRLTRCTPSCSPGYWLGYPGT